MGINRAQVESIMNTNEMDRNVETIKKAWKDGKVVRVKEEIIELRRRLDAIEKEIKRQLWENLK